MGYSRAMRARRVIGIAQSQSGFNNGARSICEPAGPGPRGVDAASSDQESVLTVVRNGASFCPASQAAERRDAVFPCVMSRTATAQVVFGSEDLQQGGDTCSDRDGPFQLLQP